jgi:Kelch motif/Galactose oxidase, central domain
LRSKPWKLRFAAGLALALGLLVPQTALGAGAGSFGPTGSMGAARYAAVAAPLKDGRVLVAGGYNDEGGGLYLASAEFFNPATNSFSSAGIGAMGTPRRGAVAAPLPDGRVLVAGGDYVDGGGDHYLASAEVFNPATNAFTPVGDMGNARVRAAAAPLPDGRVLVAGGNDGTTRLSSAEVFNPATNAFTPVGDMGTDRARAAAAPLPDGRVLVAGGTNGAPLSSAAVFDPATSSFSSAGLGAMGTARQAPAAAPLPDGRVLVSGGVYVEGPGGYLASAEVFDPATSSFSTAGIGAMGTARTGAAAAPLPDGRVLIAGGFDGSTRFSSAEIFAATNAFSFAVNGRKLLIRVQASGKVSVSDAAARLNASAAKKRKRRLLLKSSQTSGDPPRIAVALHLTKLAKQRLRRTGKVEVRASITFAPRGGLANPRTAKLKIRRTG